MPGMNETCDRCGPAVPAAYRVAGSGELYLCGHCTNLLRPALSAKGWNIRLIHQQLVTLPATSSTVDMRSRRTGRRSF